MREGGSWARARSNAASVESRIFEVGRKDGKRMDVKALLNKEVPLIITDSAGKEFGIQEENRPRFRLMDAIDVLGKREPRDKTRSWCDTQLRNVLTARYKREGREDILKRYLLSDSAFRLSFEPVYESLWALDILHYKDSEAVTILELRETGRQIFRDRILKRLEEMPG